MSSVLFIPEIDLNKHLTASFKVHRVFVDPTGCHVLVSAVHKDRDKDLEDMTAEMIYVHSSSSKPRLVFLVLKYFIQTHPKNKVLYS